MTPLQQKGFLRAGDVVIPGGDGFPSFSKSGTIRDAPRMLDYMTEADRSGLLGLMAIFAFLPAFAIRLIIAIAERNRFFPGPVGAALRLVVIGVKGAFYTLYYSDEAVHPRIHWDAKIKVKEPL